MEKKTNVKQNKSTKGGIKQFNRLELATNSFKTGFTVLLVLSCIVNFIIFVFFPIAGIIALIPIVFGFVILNVICEFLYSTARTEEYNKEQTELLEKILLENIKNNEK